MISIIPVEGIPELAEGDDLAALVCERVGGERPDPTKRSPYASGVDLRQATVADLGAVVKIYNHYVLHSFATFEEAPVSAEDRRGWFETFRSVGRHRLVVADDGRVRGYACSVPYRAHSSFDETVEFSV